MNYLLLDHKLIFHLQIYNYSDVSWWMFSLFILVLLSALYVIRKYQIRQILEDEEKRRLEEIDLLKTKLYTNISHEFRTPLTVILGMTKKLEEDIGQEEDGKESILPKVFESTSLIYRNADTLLRLVNQMLDLSKLDSGRLDVKWEFGDVILFLQYLSESFNSYAVINDIHLTFCPEVKSLEMDYDSDKLQHIIFNLLSNAIKFTPKGGKVIFRVKEIPAGIVQAGNLLQIKIINSGNGISEEHLSNIFDRFYQIDDTHRRNIEGTGIGLALTKDLVELMGGSISVKSRPGEGTEFTVSLPIRKTAVSSHDIPPIEAIVPSSAIKRKELMTSVVLTDDRPLLLLIEDNIDVATYICTCMTGEYTILWAENGQLGIEKALETIPDIIISDVIMPEKDGYEVTQFLKNDERTSHIPIILLTAKAELKDKITGLERGADAYLSKPFDKKELQVQTKKLVELRQQLQVRYARGSTIDRQKAALPELDEESQKNAIIEDAFIQKINQILDKHLSESQFDVPQLSRELHMSHSQLFRKIKALTGKSIATYICHYRLYQSRTLLQETEMNISEIAYAVGFSDPSYYSKKFLKEFGKSPTNFRK